MSRLVIVIAVLVSLASGYASAATDMQALQLDAGSGRVVALPSAVANVFVADPKVAEVRPGSAATLFIFGVGIGRTTVAALDSSGQLVAQYTVSVQASGFAAQQAQAAIASNVSDSHVRVQANTRGLLLTGTVNAPEDADEAVAIAHGYATDAQLVENRIGIKSSIQVTLRVVIAEVNRDLLRQIGVDWSALGNIGQIAKVTPALRFGVNTATVAMPCVPEASNPLCLGGVLLGSINALSQDNLVRVLAQPNLTVMSGQRASFLVGGEFPMPVGQQNGAVTIEFKNYGVSLGFVPTVYNDGRINLHVQPEVSQISNQNSVTVTTSGSTLVVPSLSVRRAESTVELGSGETFALAGLLQDNVIDGTKGIPGLGDLPILGALFRSNSFERQETELVILVTPFVVRPPTSNASLRLPSEGYAPPTEFDRLLLMRQVAPGVPPQPVHIPGAAGFMVR